MEKTFDSKYCKVEYLNDINAVVCQWKQKCSYEDYRNPLRYGLDLLHHHRAITWITDTTNGFENELKDTEWLLQEFLPEVIKSRCENVYFIIARQSPLHLEIDNQMNALSQFFNVKKLEKIKEVKTLS